MALQNETIHCHAQHTFFTNTKIEGGGGDKASVTAAMMKEKAASGGTLCRLLASRSYTYLNISLSCR